MFQQFTSESHLGPDALAPKRQPMPKGHLPFNKPAKKVLEHAVHEATRVQSGQLIPSLRRE